MMFLSRNFTAENDLRKLHALIKTQYKGMPFNKVVPHLKGYMHELAEKHNTSCAEMWKIFFDMYNEFNKEDIWQLK
jgi:hypothetical protein